MSDGTLIALAADEIVMCDHAVLGPVDPQMGQYPAVSLLKTVELKSKDKLDDETLILADQAKKAITQVQATVRELLRGKYPDPVVENLATVLSEGRWTHAFPITFEYAKELGIAHKLRDAAAGLGTDGALSPAGAPLPTVEYLPGRRVTERKIELGESGAQV